MIVNTSQKLEQLSLRELTVLLIIIFANLKKDIINRFAGNLVLNKLFITFKDKLHKKFIGTICCEQKVLIPFNGLYVILILLKNDLLLLFLNNYIIVEICHLPLCFKQILPTHLFFITITTFRNLPIHLFFSNK